MLRARLLTLGIMLVLLASFAFAARNSVHFGPPPPYNPPQVQLFESHVSAWRTGSPIIAGWTRSLIYARCETLVISVTSAGRTGYIYAGPVDPGEVVGWSGWLHDAHGAELRLTSRPRPETGCA